MNIEEENKEVIDPDAVFTKLKLACVKAWEEYNRVYDPARAEYDHICGAARGMCKRAWDASVRAGYKSICTPFGECEPACTIARENYHRIIEPARAELNRFEAEARAVLERAK